MLNDNRKGGRVKPNVNIPWSKMAFLRNSVFLQEERAVLKAVLKKTPVSFTEVDIFTATVPPLYLYRGIIGLTSLCSSGTRPAILLGQ